MHSTHRSTRLCVCFCTCFCALLLGALGSTQAANEPKPPTTASKPLAVPDPTCSGEQTASGQAAPPQQNAVPLTAQTMYLHPTIVYGYGYRGHRYWR